MVDIVDCSNIINVNHTMINILEILGHNPCYFMGDYDLVLTKHDKHTPTGKLLDVMHDNFYTHYQSTYKSHYEYFNFNLQHIYTWLWCKWFDL